MQVKVTTSPGQAVSLPSIVEVRVIVAASVVNTNSVSYVAGRDLVPMKTFNF